MFCQLSEISKQHGQQHADAILIHKTKLISTISACSPQTLGAAGICRVDRNIDNIRNQQRRVVDGLSVRGGQRWMLSHSGRGRVPCRRRWTSTSVESLENVVSGRFCWGNGRKMRRASCRRRGEDIVVVLLAFLIDRGW